MPNIEFKNRKILVVDDTLATRYAVSRVLKNEGFAVVEAANGQEALVKVKSEAPDLVTLDIHMPDINGFEVCRIIKSDPLTAHIPVLQVSASYVTSSDKIHGLEGGADSYLTHPFEPPVLIATIKALLRTKSLHEQLRASESRFKGIFEHLATGLSVSDSKGRYIQVNPAYCRMTGYTEQELVGQDSSFLTSADFKDENAKKVKSLIDGSETSLVFDKQCVRKDGSLVWTQITLSAIINGQGRVQNLIELVEDIHDRKLYQAERDQLTRQLEERSALLETVLEQFPAAVIIGEAPTGRIIFANSKVDEVWRHPVRKTDSIRDYGHWIGYHKDGSRYDGHEWPLARSISTGEVVIDEDTHVGRGDGSLGILRLSAAPVRNREGQITAGVVVCQDITEMKHTEADLQKAKLAAESASQLKSAFIANMSHEIRTPLGAILGFTSLLQDPNLSDQEKESYHSIISRNGQQLSDIINDILDLSKIEAGHVGVETLPVAPISALKDIVSLLEVKAQEKRLPINIHRSSDIPESVGTDPTRLKQILTNIIGNAIKFTQFGSIDVTISYVKQKPKPQLIIDVKDTGIGLDADQSQRLFRVFSQADASTTRKFGGTGLGLTLSKRLAILLGGNVELIKSAPNTGSTFRITIEDRIDDVKKEAVFEKTNQLQGSVDKISLNGTHILLVDDAIDNQNLLWHILTKKEATVEVAQNGLEGLQKALSGSYDVVLMDVQMPIMDGYTATAKLRERGFKKPILALTAHAMTEVRDKCLNVGCTGYLSKPINPVELIQSIHELTKKLSH